MNLAFLASHNGSAARAIVHACRRGILNARPVLLISNNPSAKALDWANEESLVTAVINAGTCEDPDRNIAALLQKHEIKFVICSGYMKLIGPQTIAAAEKILNVHPALLPKYGGKGMYGRFVHEAVYKNGDFETGITIHLVDGEYDHGAVVAQKKIPVPSGTDATGIEDMVKKAEPDFYVETLSKILSGAIQIP